MRNGGIFQTSVQIAPETLVYITSQWKYADNTAITYQDYKS